MSLAVLLMRKCRHYLFPLAVVCVVPSLSAVVVETREWHGKQIQCVLGGLGFLRPRACGAMDAEYERIFAGTVASVTEISETDRRLEIIPEENFLGQSQGMITATVNQACLKANDPDIKPGDEWLFYLQVKWYPYRDKERDASINNNFEIPFDSPSKPLTQAQEDIAKLRRLGRMRNVGVLRGTMTIGAWQRGDLPDHKITAKRQDGVEYSTLTDDNGEFEFDRLPTGTYELRANQADGFRGSEASVEVRSGRCTSTNLLVDVMSRPHH